MTLAALIRKRESGKVATAIPAISATDEGGNARTVARIATVAVASPQNAKAEGVDLIVYSTLWFAGVINIVTKTVADIPHTEVESRFGSFDTYDAWLLKRSRLGAFDLAVSLNGRTTAGYDATIQADAQTALDRLFETRASLAPGPINVARISSMPGLIFQTISGPSMQAISPALM